MIVLINCFSIRDLGRSVRDHTFKTSACLRGEGVSPFGDGHKDQNLLHKHFAGMPMVEG